MEAVDIRDFILSKSEEEVAEVPKVKKKAEVSFDIMLQSNPDFIIRRKTPRSERVLVCLVTQNQYYVKDMRNGQIEDLTVETFSKFLSGLEGRLELPECWCASITHQKSDVQDFFGALNNPDILYLIKHGAFRFHFSERNSLEPFARQLVSGEDMRVTLKVLTGVFSPTDIAKMVENGNWVYFKSAYNYNPADFYRLFGLDASREYVRQRENIPEYRAQERYLMSCLPDYTGLLKTYSFDSKRFTDYVLYDCIRQGYAGDENRFLNLWWDTLAMQMQIHGKIVDKYPKYLASMHEIYSYKVRLLKQKIDAEKLEKRVKALSAYEWEDQKYKIIIPRSAEDIIEEAHNQCNCLASYITAYINGDTDIFYLRARKRPETSLVTIEVRDGIVRQALRARNRPIGEEERKAIRKWCKTVGFGFE